MDLPPDVVAQAIEFELTTIREVMAEETGVDFSDFTNTLSFCDIGVDSLLILSIPSSWKTIPLTRFVWLLVMGRGVVSSP
jgi:hypothetical protein